MTHLPSPDTVAGQAAELRQLWPVLPAALPADGGTTTGERVRTSGNVHTIPINPAVAATISRLAPHMSHLAQYIREYTDAYHNHRTQDAAPIARNISNWLTQARTALGLNRPDRPIGAHCPHHDQPHTELVTPGDHGHLDYTSITADGTLTDGWIRWDHTDLVCCRHCRQQWTPSQYPWLGRLVRYADQRRAVPSANAGPAR